MYCYMCQKVFQTIYGQCKKIPKLCSFYQKPPPQNRQAPKPWWRDKAGKRLRSGKNRLYATDPDTGAATSVVEPFHIDPAPAL